MSGKVIGLLNNEFIVIEKVMPSVYVPELRSDIPQLTSVAEAVELHSDVTTPEVSGEVEAIP